MFDGFNRPRLVKFAAAAGMVEYSAALNPFLKALFPPEMIKMGLGETISKAGLRQLRIAETEKYAHVTFFFNGGEERQFEGEERILVPSPKVQTYDLQPEMSAPEVCRGVVDAIGSGEYDFIIVNFANGDMVGHTGVIPAVITAIETVDSCLGQIVSALRDADGLGIITADHGNAEEEVDVETGGPMTAHTTNPVPLILLTPDDHPLRHATLRTDGVLSAIAPTILDLMGISPHPDMTQRSLIER